MIIALGMVFIGALFLLRNTGLLPLAAWDFTWPLVLIVLGVAILVGRGSGFDVWRAGPARKTRS